MGRALAGEDASRPADALILLGDNFYFYGLRAAETVQRIREDIVSPFCHFVDLGAPRSSEVAGSCGIPRERRHPVPILAVLGNHDHFSEESPRLESEEIPRFVANWQLPRDAARTVEVHPGVSLVLFDSTRLRDVDDAAPLRDALRAARGPWRVLVAHHPVGTSRDRGYRKSLGFGSYGGLVRRAVAEAGVPVQLMLAGHEHNLQLIELAPPGPSLVVIAGGGSSPRSIRSDSAGRRFGLESLGFARVDFPQDPASGGALVSLFRTSRWDGLLGREARPVARWSVGLDGAVGPARSEAATGTADASG